MLKRGENKVKPRSLKFITRIPNGSSSLSYKKIKYVRVEAFTNYFGKCCQFLQIPHNADIHNAFNRIIRRLVIPITHCN